MRLAVVGINHGHVYELLTALLAVPGVEVAAFSADEDDLAAQFSERYPDVPRKERSWVLADDGIDLVVSAAINADRGPIAVATLQAGKHVLVDKPPLTTLADLDAVEAAVADSGKRWFVGFGERLGNPLHERLRDLIRSGTLGRTVSFTGFGPHRLLLPTRPAWMIDPEQYGGVINDIGIHQVELFRWLTGERIVDFRSRTANFGTPEYPNFDDYGDVWFEGERGTAGYVQVHWYTPEASPTWGDVRQFVVGTLGSVEVRSNANLGGSDVRPLMITTTHSAPPERYVSPGRHRRWAEQMVADIRDGVDRWMPQQDTFDSVRTVLRMQAEAQRLTVIL